MLYKRLSVVFLLLSSLVISACVPEDSSLIEINIIGVEQNASYTLLPDIHLDYEQSALRAQQAGIYAQFQNKLKNVQVILNGSNITTAFKFSQRYAVVSDEQRILDTLKAGNNTLNVRLKADASSGEKARQLDIKAFKYVFSGPKVYLSNFINDGNNIKVLGYALSGSGIMSVKLNGVLANINGQRFNVSVPKSKNYTLVVEDGAGKRLVKRYVNDSYIRNAIRLRVDNSFVNQQALRNEIIKQLGSELSVDTNKINPILELNIPLASVSADLQNPISLGQATIRKIQF